MTYTCKLLYLKVVTHPFSPVVQGNFMMKKEIIYIINWFQQIWKSVLYEWKTIWSLLFKVFILHVIRINSYIYWNQKSWPSFFQSCSGPVQEWTKCPLFSNQNMVTLIYFDLRTPRHSHYIRSFTQSHTVDDKQYYGNRHTDRSKIAVHWRHRLTTAKTQETTYPKVTTTEMDRAGIQTGNCPVTAQTHESLFFQWDHIKFSH